jgi:hypothetical protein
MSENSFVGDTKEAKKSRKWLTNLLKEYVIEVTFTKKDGTERVMNCTLLEDYLPETTGVGNAASLDALAVYDVDKEDWRSFRWDSIKSIKVIVESANA